MTKMKVIRKDNHDTMWIKVGYVKNWVKLNVSRGGWKVKASNKSLTPIFNDFVAKFKELHKDNNYGVSFDLLEEYLNEKYCKC